MKNTIKSMYPSERMSWYAARRRCHDTRDSNYHHYGGNGISMCNEWRNDFAQFLFDMGPKPSLKHTLDRIDNHKGYCHQNCRWITKQEQNWNKKTTIQKTLNGITKPLAQWCSEFNIPYGKVMLRLKYGWSLEDALTRS